MIRTTRNLVWARDKLSTFLTSIDAAAPTAAGVFNQAHNIYLFTNSFDPHPDMVFGDFVEPTFSGYTPKIANDFQGPGNVLDVGKVIEYTYKWFLAAVGTPPGDTIQGYFTCFPVTVGGEEVIFAERFLDPVPIALQGDYLNIRLLIQLPFNWPASP